MRASRGLCRLASSSSSRTSIMLCSKVLPTRTSRRHSQGLDFHATIGRVSLILNSWSLKNRLALHIEVEQLSILEEVSSTPLFGGLPREVALVRPFVLASVHSIEPARTGKHETHLPACQACVPNSRRAEDARISRMCCSPWACNLGPCNPFLAFASQIQSPERRQRNPDPKRTWGGLSHGV